MSQDALRCIVRQMPFEERLKMSAVDEELHFLASRWVDVDSLLVGESQLAFGDQKTQHAWIPNERRSVSISQALVLCPSIQRLFVQTKFTSAEFGALASRAATLHKLYICSDNFVNIAEWGELLFKRLRSLSILQRMDLPIRLNNRINAIQLQRVLSPSLRRVCLTGVVLMPDALPVIFSLPNLRSLDLIGTAVDSKEAADIIPKLTCPVSLDEVSLPPSLFSFSKLASNKDVNFDFRWLTAPKVCLYMEVFDENTFFNKAEQIMAKETVVLVLYGNYIRAKASSKMKKWKRFNVMYGPNVAQTLNPVFCPGWGLLVSHLVLHSPYASGEIHQGSIESWRLDLTRMVDEPPVAPNPRAAHGENILRMLLNNARAGRNRPAPPVPPRVEPPPGQVAQRNEMAVSPLPTPPVQLNRGVAQPNQQGAAAQAANNIVRNNGNGVVAVAQSGGREDLVRQMDAFLLDDGGAIVQHRPPRQ